MDKIYKLANEHPAIATIAGIALATITLSIALIIA